MDILAWHLRRHFNTLRPRQNGRHFADDIFKCIFLNENVWISIGISLKFVPRGPIINIPALVQIMDWCRSGDKPLSEPMMSILLTHICVTRPQWVKIEVVVVQTRTYDCAVSCSQGLKKWSRYLRVWCEIVQMICLLNLFRRATRHLGDTRGLLKARLLISPCEKFSIL